MTNIEELNPKNNAIEHNEYPRRRKRRKKRRMMIWIRTQEDLKFK